MEPEISASPAASDEWIRPLDLKDTDEEVSPVPECAPAVGAEVVCSGEGSQAVGKRRKRFKKKPNFMQTQTRQEDENCAGCQAKFERQGRSFSRRALCTFTNLETARWTFPQAALELTEASFFCEACAQLIRCKYRKRQCGKRTLWIRPVKITEQKEPEPQPKKERFGKKSRAAFLVNQSRYMSAFKLLWSAKGARKPMMNFLSKQLKLEMKELSRQQESPFHQKVVSSRPISKFPWQQCVNWAQTKAPLVTHCIKALFPNAVTLANSSNILTEEEASDLLDRRIVTALSIPLFTRNIYKNNFVQASLGAELRLHGLSGSGLDSLNTLGLSQSKDSVRHLLLRLLKGRRAKLLPSGRYQKLKQEQYKTDIGSTRNGEGSEERREEEETNADPAEVEVMEEEEDEIDEDEDDAVDDLEENEEEPKSRTSKKRKANEEEEEEELSPGRKMRRVVVVRMDPLTDQ